MEFYGTDDVINVPSHASLDIIDGFTLEAWIKPAVVNQQQVFLQKWYDGSTYDKSFAIQILSSNYPAFGIRNADNTGETWLTSTTNAVAANSWCHISGVNDTSTMYLYFNGRQDPQTASGFTGRVSAFDILIGLYDGLPFNGTIGEIRIYNRALTPQEIQQNYLATEARYQ